MVVKQPDQQPLVSRYEFEMQDEGMMEDGKLEDGKMEDRKMRRWEDGNSSCIF